MKIIYKLHDGQTYVYEENMWSGKKTLTVNDMPAERFNKNEFKIGDEIYAVKGSFLTGVKLISTVNPSNTIVLAQNKWWEWILIFLPMVLWAVTLVPLIGGWLWSLIGGIVASTTNARILRSEMNLLFRVLLCLAVFVLAFAFWAGMSYLVSTSLS